MRWLAPILAGLLFAGCGSQQADPPSGPPRAIRIGIAGHVEGSRADVASELKAVRLTGARWFRDDFAWSAVQPAAGGGFDWSHYDELVAAAARQRMHVLPILDASPCWAVKASTAPDKCSMTFPADRAAFGRYAGAAVARYGPGGSFWSAHPSLDRNYAIRWWEVWNEPYLTSGALPVSAGAYAATFEAAADAGRRQSPRTKWLFAAAGSATREDGTQFDWLPAVAASAPHIAAKIDALAIHVYPRAAAGETLNATAGAGKVVATFKREFGVQRPAWITELGFAACAPDSGASPCVPGPDRGAREAAKARLLEQAIGQFRRTSFTAAVFVYTLREYDVAFHGDVGLIAGNGHPLPAYRAFQRAAK